MRRFSFWCLSVRVGDSCIFMESELTCTCTMLEFQPVFRTLFEFLYVALPFMSCFLLFETPLKFVLAHPSWLVDIRNEACMGSSHSRSWFSFLVVPLESFVLSIATKKSHLHLHSIVPHPPRNRAHPQNPSSFTLHTIHSHHPSHPPSSHLHYSPPAWRPMHIATIILSL